MCCGPSYSPWSLMCWFGFKGEIGYAKFLLDVVWLISAGVCLLALLSGVMTLVGGV